MHVDGKKYISNTVTVYNIKVTEYKKCTPNIYCKTLNVDVYQTYERADCLCDVALIIALFKLLKEMD